MPKKQEETRVRRSEIKAITYLRTNPERKYPIHSHKMNNEGLLILFTSACWDLLFGFFIGGLCKFFFWAMKIENFMPIDRTTLIYALTGIFIVAILHGWFVIYRHRYPERMSEYDATIFLSRIFHFMSGFNLQIMLWAVIYVFFGV